MPQLIAANMLWKKPRKKVLLSKPTPSQNAQNFFKNYKKKQTAARMLVDLLAEGEKEIAYLGTVLYEVCLLYTSSTSR